MNRLRNVLLRKCRSLSRVGSSGGGGRRSSMSSYSSLRSMSARDAAVAVAGDDDDEVADDGAVVVFVGSSRRRYVISAEHLGHPLIAALLVGGDDGDVGGVDGGGKRPAVVAVNCEVVLFDHLLWMLDSGAVDLREDDGEDAMRELAQLYAC